MLSVVTFHSLRVPSWAALSLSLLLASCCVLLYSHQHGKFILNHVSIQLDHHHANIHVVFTRIEFSTSVHFMNVCLMLIQLGRNMIYYKFVVLTVVQE
jgi:hypothetical protein